MLVHVLVVVGGLALLPLGAEALVRGSAGTARRLGVSALVIGLTVVAFGTSSPEIVVSIQAASRGDSGIALGNVLGSNVSNIALVLGFAALVRPLRAGSVIIAREVPIMIGVSLVLTVMLLDGMLSRYEGAALLVGAAAYTVVAYLLAERVKSVDVAGEFEDAYPAPRSWLVDSVLILAGLAALIGGAQLLVSGAVFLASALGVSQVVIGLSVVAIGTSLPELATCVAAAAREEADVALGNVIGSNVLNILVVLGIAAVVRPFAVQGLRTADLVVFVLSAVVLLPILRRGWVLNRWEGGLLLTGYVVYIATLVA